MVDQEFAPAVALGSKIVHQTAKRFRNLGMRERNINAVAAIDIHGSSKYGRITSTSRVLHAA
jgi:hypothetical protein